ncbi:HAD-IA family hydrolase [Vibrio sp. HN007]|uniref:HAD-IA family hydrolase n=1 Tax=Vibrio iocasae TaxID=3098914 RepID=UPI0035D45057
MMNFKGILFDLDGTLVDSNAAVDRCWSHWCDRNDLDYEEVSKVFHGKPAFVTVREFLAGKSDEYIASEIQWLKDQESKDVSDVKALPGALEFLDRVVRYKVPWAIVTSGPVPVARARIEAARLPEPHALITSDLITKGKPDPEPFLLGAGRIGIDAKECLVFEDSPAGAKAGISAGSKVIGVMSHLSESDLNMTHSNIKTMTGLGISALSNSFRLTFK